MIYYVDSSVVLRLVLSQPDALEERLEHAVTLTSELTRVECQRVLDRVRLQGSHSDEELLGMRDVLSRFLQRCEVLQLNPFILQQAGIPLPVVLGTLDAIHLASALVAGATAEEGLTLATHDLQLGHAAQAMGLAVVGI